jgi:hypothetical protein
MRPLLLAAWRGLPTGGTYDLQPILWIAFLAALMWGLGVRLRWWSLGPIAVGGTLCTTMSNHFGLGFPAIALATCIPLLLVGRRIARQS